MELRLFFRIVELDDECRFRLGDAQYFIHRSEKNVALVDETAILDAQECISACEYCEDNAPITFEYLLDAVTGCDPTMTEYVMNLAAKCPRCRHEITEKTRVVPN